MDPEIRKLLDQQIASIDHDRRKRISIPKAITGDFVSEGTGRTVQAYSGEGSGKKTEKETDRPNSNHTGNQKKPA